MLDGGLERSDDWLYIWPSFVWTFLTGTSVSSAVGRIGPYETWKFVPFRWRAWWLASLVEYQPPVWARSGLSLEEPMPHFTDVTEDLRRFESMLDTLELGNIRKLCNELNFPTVYCPWGCLTFLQDIGGLDLSAAFYHLLRKERVIVDVMSSGCVALANCLSMRKTNNNVNESGRWGRCTTGYAGQLLHPRGTLSRQPVFTWEKKSTPCPHRRLVFHQ